MDDSGLFLDDINLDIESNERNRAFWLNIAGLIGVVFPPLNLILIFVIWKLDSENSSFVKTHAVASLNFYIFLFAFQILGWLSISYYNMALGILLILAASVIIIASSLSAANKAKNGKRPEYAFDFVKIVK